MTPDVWITVGINSLTILGSIGVLVWKLGGKEQKIYDRLSSLELNRAEGDLATQELRKLCHELLLTVTRMSVIGGSQSDHLKDIELRLRRVESKYLRGVHETPREV